ncbi:MAG: iron-sulfur cluster assembly scaffold protein [Epsilonproteobacteria bacterium]|nr:iron-sulfur cluster assembly scaffold protein [Campylobacterota bacterium]
MNEIAMTKEQEELLKEHFNHPKNFGKLKEYNAKGVCVNPDKDAKVTIFLKVNDDNKVVEDIGFLIKGCKSTILTGSLFSDTVKGETLDEGVDLCNELLPQMENHLTPDKEKPRLVMHAFLAAVENYGKKDEKQTVKVIRTVGEYDYA